MVLAQNNVDLGQLDTATGPNLSNLKITDFFTSNTGFNSNARRIGLVNIVFVFAGVALLLYFLTAGFKMMTAAGDPKKMQEAQVQIKNALLGFIIIFASYWIVQIAASLLGVGQISSVFSTP